MEMVREKGIQVQSAPQGTHCALLMKAQNPLKVLKGSKKGNNYKLGQSKLTTLG